MQSAEQSVIGCLIMQPQLIQKAIATLGKQMFESEALGKAFACMRSFQKQGKTIDLVTVVSELGEDYKQILTMCAETVPSISGFDAYCAAVVDAWRKRTVIMTMQEMLCTDFATQELVTKLRDIVVRQNEISAKMRTSSENEFMDALMETYEDLFKPDTALKTEWEQFNRVFGGFQRGNLYMIAGRPGKGKSDFSLHLAVMLAKAYRVNYQSLEMTQKQIVHRILSRVCGINSVKFRDKAISDNDNKKIDIVFKHMKELHIILDETAKQDIAYIESKILTDKPDILFVDHLGLVAQTGRGKKAEWEAIGEITKELKAMCKRYNIAIVTLVQLSRTVDRTGRPALCDLRGGGNVEADADGVIFMWPEEIPQGKILSGNDFVHTEVIVAKNREGGTGELEYHWQPQYHDYTPVEYRRE